MSPSLFLFHPSGIAARLGVMLLACAVLAVPVAAAPALSDPLPVNPQLRLGKLDNGLTYYIQKNAKPAQRVELRLVVKAGSVLEDEDQLGAAHFVEHLAFAGSTHFKKNELVSYLQSIGVRSTSDLNAFTGFDSTRYILPVPTDKPENLERGLLVLEDWAHGLTLSDQAIEEERKIVLEEKRLRAGFGRRMQEAMLPKLANGSRYKDRMVLGTEASIANNSADALRRFYRDWYRPDLMAVIVVGDIDPEAVERIVRRRFGQIKMPAAPRPRPQHPLPPLGAPDALVFTDKEAPGSSVRLTYATYQRTPASTIGDYRGELVRRLFAELMGMRVTRLPVPRGSAGESPSPFGPNQYTYSAIATVGANGVHRTIDALVGENERVRQFGFTESELETARRSIMAGYEHAAKARETRSSAAVLDEYVRHFLDREPIPGIANEVEYARTFLPGITRDEVNAHAKALIPADGPKLILYTTNPAGTAPVPAAGELLARVEPALQVSRPRNVEQALPAQLVERKPAAGSIVGQSEDKALGITRLVLSNGVKVVLKPTPFSKDSVQMSAVRPGGQMLFADADKTALRFAGQLQGAMGAGPHSMADLRRILAGKNLALTAGMDNYADYLSGRSNSGDLETLLQLNYLSMSSPRRDRMVFRSFVNNNAERALSQGAAPEGRFADARVQAVYGGHPRALLRARPEDYRSLDMDRSLDLFHSRMGSAKGMTFFLVGDFDIEAVKPLLATWVASLPVADLPLQYRDPGMRQVAGVKRQEIKAGVEQKSLVTYNFGGDVEYSKAGAAAFQALVEVLKMRITEALRIRHQLIYASGVNGRYGRIPHPSYAIAIDLPTAPQNVEKLETALWEEIVRLQSEGPATAELNKIKLAMLQGYRKSLAENGYWLQRLQSAELEGDDPRDILSVEQRIEALTEAQVQAAAKRFLDKERYVEMVLKPEV